ncbi:hypothetical protein niasHT_003577 [Heterodera trifolii]|uniref:UBC core domain-containing protein n=1 Tax=Heterodera trifolii TaxID=157864 RepID=A0ABD2M6L1_9BILA
MKKICCNLPVPRRTGAADYSVCVCHFFVCVFAAQPETTPSAAQITRTGTNTRERSRSPSPRRLLMRQYESLLQNSNNGFRASIENNNIFKWRIIIDGPPETPYAGFSFTALLEFPVSFPDYPPTFTFLTDILHPNIYTATFLLFAYWC